MFWGVLAQVAVWAPIYMGAYMGVFSLLLDITVVSVVMYIVWREGMCHRSARSSGQEEGKVEGSGLRNWQRAALKHTNDSGKGLD